MEKNKKLPVLVDEKGEQKNCVIFHFLRLEIFSRSTHLRRRLARCFVRVFNFTSMGTRL
jgi:hypothetical protein